MGLHRCRFRSRRLTAARCPFDPCAGRRPAGSDGCERILDEECTLPHWLNHHHSKRAGKTSRDIELRCFYRAGIDSYSIPLSALRSSVPRCQIGCLLRQQPYPAATTTRVRPVGRLRAPPCQARYSRHLNCLGEGRKTVLAAGRPSNTSSFYSERSYPRRNSRMHDSSGFLEAVLRSPQGDRSCVARFFLRTS